MKKIILTLAVFCFLVADAAGQEIEWQNTIGGSLYEGLMSVAETMDGGVIIGGISNSPISGDKTESCIGGIYDDYWVVKLDASGNVQWENTIGGNSTELLWSIQQTTDGGYILGGGSESDISGDKTENNMGLAGTDYWVVKLDASGNIQWQNTIGGNSSDDLLSLQQTSDGGFILGGQSYSDASGDKTENNTGIINFWIVKIDSIGNIQWDNTIGGNHDDRCHFIRQTFDGGYIAGGLSDSPISGDKTENCQGQWDFWVVKLDSIGNIEWQNTIGGSLHDILYCIKQTSDKGYLCGGPSYSNISGDKTENSFGANDYWAVKLDSSGNIQWQRTLGGSGGENLMTLEEIKNGEYLVGGMSGSGVSGNKTVYKGGGDMWTVLLDGTGNIILQSAFGGYSGDGLYSMSKSYEESYFLAGTSNSDIGADKHENSLGYNDFWVMKVTDNYNLISGKLYADLNSNNVQDSGEPAMSNKQVTETSTGRFCLSELNGIYNLSVLDSGNFSVSPASINYYSAVPATQTAYFSGINQTDSLNDFAFQPSGVFNDLCITITPMGNFRAGMNASYMINYENVGTTTLNATVIFFPDNDVTYVSANPTATSVTTDSVVWNVGTLTPFQTGSILVTVNVNAGTPIGTMINSNVRIEPVAGDNYPGCNYAYWEIYTTGSYDPNAILVDRDTVLTTELSSPPYLNYIIYFQNTGNDTAFNARVLNNIPQTLDVNSFEFVAASHPMNITYGAHSRLFTFTFDNILLPDSNVNEPASHGFIRYRIKPLSTLVVGDSIENTAFIYFDFNQPVMTNTAVTEIVLPTSLTPGPSPKERGVTLTPNPVTDELTVSFSPSLRGGLVGLHIFDLYGREVLKMEAGGQKSEVRIDVSGYSQGVYIIEINDGKIKARSKFVKQ